MTVVRRLFSPLSKTTKLQTLHTFKKGKSHLQTVFTMKPLSDDHDFFAVVTSLAAFIALQQLLCLLYSWLAAGLLPIPDSLQFFVLVCDHNKKQKTDDRKSWTQYSSYLPFLKVIFIHVFFYFWIVGIGK